MARTTQASQTRAAAAKRQESANVDRTKSDALELDALTGFELAQRRRDEAVKALVAAEHDMACELEKLFQMGNSLDRVLVLTGETDKDTIKRIRKLARPSAVAGSERSAKTTNGAHGRAPGTG